MHVQNVRISSEKGKKIEFRLTFKNSFFKKMLKKRKGHTAITSTSTTLTNNNVLQK